EPEREKVGEKGHAVADQSDQRDELRLLRDETEAALMRLASLDEQFGDVADQFYRDMDDDHQHHDQQQPPADGQGMSGELAVGSTDESTVHRGGRSVGEGAGFWHDELCTLAEFRCAVQFGKNLQVEPLAACRASSHSGC